MKEFVNKNMWVSIFSSTMFFILGIVMVINPVAAIEWFTLAIEILLIASGIAAVITYLRSDKDYVMSSYNFVYGVIGILIAVFLMINSELLASIFPLLIGFWMTIGSLIKIKFSFSLKEDKSGILYIAASFIMFTCGLAIVFHPFIVAVEIVRIIGIILLVYSTTDVIQSILFKKHVDKFEI